MESLADRGIKLAETKDTPEGTRQASELLQQAMDIFQGLPDPTNDAVQSTALHVFSTAATIYLQRATHHQRNPSQQISLQNAQEAGSQGLSLAQTAGFGPDATLHFDLLLGKIHSLQLQDCKAADHLDAVYQNPTVQKDFKVLEQHGVLLLTVSSIGSCHPERGVQLWRKMIDQGYLSLTDTFACPSCWAFIMVAHERTNHGAALELDRLGLAETTPYRHALQVPRMINTALLTETAQPYQDPQQSSVCQVLLENKREILAEYRAYQDMVQKGKMVNLHEQQHQDMTLSEESGGGWDGLFLLRGEAIEPDESGNKRESGWQEHTCSNHFPKTCAVLQAIPEVNGKLLRQGGAKNCGSHNNSGYPNWCFGNENNVAGVVSFYSLQPKTSLRLHTGPTNQRLKCHMVVAAPNDGSAWMEVGGVRKIQTTGDVIAFDDSYLHRVGNDHATEIRVILDVTHYHPDLITTAHVEHSNMDDNPQKDEL